MLKGTSRREDSDFKDNMISDSFLSDAIDWIRGNLSPNQVFEFEQLEEWARDNDFVHVDDKS